MKFCIAALSGPDVKIEEHGLDARELRLPRQLYCTTKPVVALAYLALLERHGIDCTRAGIDLDGALVENGGLSVLDILSHRTGLTQPDYWMSMAMPARIHDSMFQQFASDQSATESRQANRARYSEVLTWWLLRRTGDALCGGNFDRALTHFLDVLLGERRLLMAPDPLLLSAPYESLSTGFLDDGTDVVPMLHGIGRRARLLTSSHFGGFGTPIALADWYLALLRVRRGDRAVPGAAALFPSAALLERLADDRLFDGDGARRSYELGFQINLHEHGFNGSIGPGAFGHHGAGGSLFACADPTDDTVWFGVADTFHTTIERRDAQIRAVASAAGKRAAEMMREVAV